jgi:hypothetical protein
MEQICPSQLEIQVSFGPNDVTLLKQLVKGNTPTGVMSIELGVSLKPTNQSTYNRWKK